MKTHHKNEDLTIQSLHINNVVWDNNFEIDLNTQTLKISMNELSDCFSSNIIKSIDIKIINPNEHSIIRESIMDIIPISVKKTGQIGNGITHTLTGVYIILSAADELGDPICSFGNTKGSLDSSIQFGMVGTPEVDDFLISFEVILQKNTGKTRKGPNAIHESCDLFCNKIRKPLQELLPDDFTEIHKYPSYKENNQPKIAMVKLVSGQGCMYDTVIKGNQPSSFIGGTSIVDQECHPIFLTPNEYRDGAIRALY